jgi:hypothetical protein
MIDPQWLDISFTAGPSSLQINPGNEHDPSARFWDIASLLYSPDKDALNSPQPSGVHGVAIPPDEQLACFDYLYYVCASHVRALCFVHNSLSEWI